MRFVYLKRTWATFVAFPEIQDGGQKEIMSGKYLNFDLQGRVTVLSLLSCIFVMLNSQRLRLDVFQLFPSSKPKYSGLYQLMNRKMYA